MSIFWNCYLSMSIGSEFVSAFDPSVLPPLSELAARISQSLPVHHYWLTDALQGLGVDANGLTNGVEGIIRLEQLLVSNALSHSIAAEQLASAAAAQFQIDAVPHLIEQALRSYNV